MDELRHVKRLKISGIILALSVALTVLLFNGRISEFSPKHNMVFFEIVKTGSIPMFSMTDFTPGFYVFGAALVHIAGLSEYQSLFIPILLVPITLLLFSILYRISGSTILSSLLVGGYLLFGSNGTDKLFLGLHGVGWVLLFSTILSLLILFATPRQKSFRRHLSIFLAASLSVVFISYNRSAELLLLFVWVGILVIALSSVRKPEWGNKSPILNRAPTVLFVVVTITGAFHVFVNTFLERFVPWFVWATVESDRSGLGRLLSLRFGTETEAPLSDLFVHTPMSLTLIGMGRYLLMAAMMLAFLGFAGVRIARRDITTTDVIVVAVIAGQGMFAAIRAAIGNLNVTFAIIPSLFAIASLYAIANAHESRRVQRGIKAASVGVAVILFVSIAIYGGIALQEGTLNDSKRSFVTADSTVDWHASHIDSGMRSDEYMANLIRIHAHDHSELDPMADVQQASQSEIQTAVGRQDMDSERYFITDTRLNFLVFDGWNRLMPWRVTEQTRLNDAEMEKVYDQGGVSTYKYTPPDDSTNDE